MPNTAPNRNSVFRSSRSSSLALGLVALVLLALVCSPATAQEIPRTASGKPDLTGTYNGATLTPLVRPKEYGDNLYLSVEEAERIAEEEALILELRDQASDPDREAPPRRRRRLRGRRRQRRWLQHLLDRSRQRRLCRRR